MCISNWYKFRWIWWKTCSIIRGKGIFNKVIESVKLLQNNGFHQISLSIVTGDKNEYIEEKFRELSDKLKTKAIIRRFMSIGRGKDSKEIFWQLMIQNLRFQTNF